MSSLLSRLGEPVKREGADRYVLITLLGFAASVILTRWFLEYTGYPQLGDSTLHIAHMLWGGLLLYIGALLPLVLANRWVYAAGGLSSGVGMGLFIDEVGKFITRTNDYFYPPAAPIIYACFLLTVLLYLRVRRPPSRNPRAELYRALDAMAEVLDHGLDRRARAHLEARLQAVAQQASHPDLARLATALLDFLASNGLQLAPAVPSRWERWRERLRALEARWITRRRLKAILVFGFATAGPEGLVALFLLLVVALGPPVFPHDPWGDQLVNAGSLPWLLPGLALKGLSGLFMLAAAGMLLIGRDRRGVVSGYVGLLLSLTIANLPAFYFNQFHAIADSLSQFALLLGALHYRRRYLAT